MQALARLKAILTWEFPEGLVRMTTLVGGTAMFSVISLLGVVIFGPGKMLIFLAAVVAFSLLQLVFESRPYSTRIQRIATLRYKRVLGNLRHQNGSDAEALLSKCMDRYAAMQTFSAVTDLMGAAPNTTRAIFYERPNRFRVESNVLREYTMSSICDGTSVVERSNHDRVPEQRYPSPDSIASVTSVFMRHTMFCASPLYLFFAGSQSIRSLVDLSMADITLGATEEIAGESATKVCFYATGTFGNMQALIGEETGLLYRLEFDSEPLTQQIQSPAQRVMVQRTLQRQLEKMPAGEERKQCEALIELYSKPYKRLNQLSPGKTGMSIHVFRDIKVDGELPERTFDIEKLSVSDPAIFEGHPDAPPKIGESAPAFTVYNLDGDAVSVTAMRGNVILLDLWATWCGPCRQGLPDIMDLAAEFAEMGVQVLAVTNDQPKLIEEFMAEENMKDLPAHLDSDGDVWSRYKVDAVPTVLIIDAEGNLSAYLVGLRRKEEIRAAIEAAL